MCQYDLSMGVVMPCTQSPMHTHNFSKEFPQVLKLIVLSRVFLQTRLNPILLGKPYWPNRGDLKKHDMYTSNKHAPLPRENNYGQSILPHLKPKCVEEQRVQLKGHVKLTNVFFIKLAKIESARARRKTDAPDEHAPSLESGLKPRDDTPPPPPEFPLQPAGSTTGPKGIPFPST